MTYKYKIVHAKIDGWEPPFKYNHTPVDKDACEKEMLSIARKSRGKCSTTMFRAYEMDGENVVSLALIHRLGIGTRVLWHK